MVPFQGTFVHFRRGISDDHGAMQGSLAKCRAIDLVQVNSAKSLMPSLLT